MKEKSRTRNVARSSKHVEEFRGLQEALLPRDDVDVSKEIRNALKASYPPDPTQKVVLLPREAFYMIVPELEEEFQGRDEGCPFIMVHCGTITPARVH